MATTSDSDDFESADEDIQEETKVIRKVVPSLKSACQQELQKQPAVTLSPERDGSGDIPLAPSLDAGHSSMEVDTTVEIASFSPVSAGHTAPPIERRRREQKPRVAKSGSGPKKLGTKITTNETSVLPTTTDTPHQSETDDPASTIPDPYAKFRGYSQPPIMQRCWVSDPQTGAVILDNNVNKIMSKADVTNAGPPPATNSTESDPYAKFRGFSEPPLMEGCWEVGVNDIASKTKPLVNENETYNDTKMSEQESKPIPPIHMADPYAKYRGYSEPPLMERCWEDGVDDIAEAKLSGEESKTSEEPKLTEDSSKPNLDPYAKFRGYSQPPLIERCWEEGVDDIEKPVASACEGATAQPKDQERVQASNTEEPQAKLAPVFDKLADNSSSSWGSWGTWSGGVTSLLSSATEGVSTLTSHVSSVLESSIGVPTPEELAQAQHNKKLFDEIKSPEPVSKEHVTDDHSTGMFGFGQLMSNMTRLVETTGNKVLTGGLDTLETIGKKTMEVLQEGDPGLKKKRAMFTDKTVLSQILREAKEKAEIESKELEDKQATRNVHFETLFDDYQGLVHLEALEMLSKQCGLKLQSLLLANSGPALAAWQAKLQGIKDSCQLPDDEDIPDDADEWQVKLVQAEKALGVPMATEKLDSIWKETNVWINAAQGEEMNEPPSNQEIHEKAISILARLTAVSVEQFHKGAELLLVQESRSPSVEADALIKVTAVLCSQVSTAATRFCELLNEANKATKSEAVNSLITNIFLEASNSSSYIQEAFQLLIPVLQVGLVS